MIAFGFAWIVGGLVGWYVGLILLHTMLSIVDAFVSPGRPSSGRWDRARRVRPWNAGPRRGMP